MADSDGDDIYLPALDENIATIDQSNLIVSSTTSEGDAEDLPNIDKNITTTAGNNLATRRVRSEGEIEDLRNSDENIATTVENNTSKRRVRSEGEIELLPPIAENIENSIGNNLGTRWSEGELEFLPTAVQRMATRSRSKLATRRLRSEGDIHNVSNLQEFFKLLEIKSVDTRHVVESVAYDEDSRWFIEQMGELLRRAADTFEGKQTVLGMSDQLKILSESFRIQYPDLRRFLKEWKPCRQELIETSATFADRMERNSNLLSVFRILTSVADIAGTFLKPKESRFALATLAMENAPAIALCSLFVENFSANKMYYKIKTIARRDQELFSHMKRWFQQTEELDRAVRNFFPYGIDEDLLRRIDSKSRTSDTFSNLFMSIVASNARKNGELFQNEEFLVKATRFASSEAGTHWYNKVILDPIWRECFSSQLSGEISKLSTSLQNPAIIGLDVTNMLYRNQQTKLLLNTITIYSAVSDLWSDTKKENSETLREMARKSKRELDAMGRIMELLRPRGFKRDDDLT